MRLLVTGGSGFLGGELLRQARAAGWEATGTHLANPGDGTVKLDVTDPAAVERLVAALLAADTAGVTVDAQNSTGSTALTSASFPR